MTGGESRIKTIRWMLPSKAVSMATTQWPAFVAAHYQP